MKILQYTFILFTLFAVSAKGTAQQTVQDIRESMMTSGLEEPVAPAEYILMPGDSLLITITGATNYSYMTGVTYEGKVTINMPVTSIPSAQGVYLPQYDVVEAVPVHKLNLIQAKDSLRRVFKKYFRHVGIDVTLIGMRTFTVFVIGEVAYPGKVTAWPVDRVSVTIERAGGFTATGSRSRVEIRRENEPPILVDIDAFERTGNRDSNPYVQDGDIIYVPRMRQSVIVRGAVFGKHQYEMTQSSKPAEELTETAGKERYSEGIYELNDGETIADIITKAGGITPWTDMSNAYIERKGAKIFINLAEALSDEDSKFNILMADGDVLYIPSTALSVYVEGRVEEPGAFMFQPHLRTRDYIGFAGGVLNDADMGRVHVVRGDQSLPASDNPVIEPGDKIVVPRVLFKFWQDYLQITSVFATLLISYLTLRAASSN